MNNLRHKAKIIHVIYLLVIFSGCDPEDFGRGPEPGWQYWQDLSGVKYPFHPNDLSINSNSIWVAAENGIFSFNDTSWTKYDSITTQQLLPKISYYAIDVSPDKTVWAGGSWGTIVRYSNGKWDTFPDAQQYISSSVITAIRGINQTNAWIASDSFGLLEYRNSLWYHWKASEGSNTIPSNKVNDILLDRQQRVWIATNRGLARYENQRWEHFSIETTKGQLPDNEVTALALDSTKRLWIGTRKGYLVIYDGVLWKIYSPDSLNRGLPGLPVLGLAIDQVGITWIGFALSNWTNAKGYREGGIMRFDGTKWLRYTTTSTASGMPGEYIDDIEIDHHNHKWFAIAGGVTRYSKE